MRQPTEPEIRRLVNVDWSFELSQTHQRRLSRCESPLRSGRTAYPVFCSFWLQSGQDRWALGGEVGVVQEINPAHPERYRCIGWNLQLDND